MLALPSHDDSTTTKRIKLAYLVSHPIQYQAPLLRRIAQEPDIDLTVFFGSDFSVRGYKDEGFGVGVTWDVPLLDGYRYEFLPTIRDNGTQGTFAPISRGILSRLQGRNGESAFDVLWVHGYATVNAMQGLLAAKSLGIPALLRAESWMGDRTRSGVKLIAKELFFQTLKSLVSGVLPIGTFNQQYWRHYFGDEVPLFPMPYAVDNEYFHQRSIAARTTRKELLTELGIDEGRPVILFASKLQRRKNCGDLLEAYQRLINRRDNQPVPYLLIVGDGEERAELEARTAALNLTDVRFCGFRNQSELPRFFDICSVFVLPSRHEPWGLIVNEVMNASRAVIVSDDVGCSVDLITDGVEGCIFPVGNIDALTNALHRVLATPETAAEMGQQALARVQQWSFEEDVRGLRRAIAECTRQINIGGEL